MASTSNTEVDPVLKKAIRLLHSSHPNSATELRLLLDELIIQRYGPDKPISNILNKRFLDEEANFPGIVRTPPPAPQQPPQPEPLDEVINLTHSPDSDEPMIVAPTTSTEDETNLKDFGDLNCCVCSEMMITATNRLIECSKCSLLYHQECHKPPITDEEASEDQESNWICSTCFNKPSTSKAAGIVVIPDEQMPLATKTKSSTASSRSSSPVYKQDAATTAPAAVASSTSQASGSSSSSSSKHHHHHHKSSSSTHSSSSKSSSKSSKHSEGGNKRKSHK